MIEYRREEKHKASKEQSVRPKDAKIFEWLTPHSFYLITFSNISKHSHGVAHTIPLKEQGNICFFLKVLDIILFALDQCLVYKSCLSQLQ